MNCTKASDMMNNVLQGRMKELKESEEGVGIMCALMEELQKKGEEKGRREGKLQAYFELVIDGIMSLKEVADRLDMKEEELKVKMEMMK